MSPRNPTGRRRQQLAHMDSQKLDALCEPAIGTAQSILDLAARSPKAVSPILRGTAGKYLNDTLASLAGYRGAPTRKIKNLLSKLCTPGIPYPYAPLDHGPADELDDLVKDAIKLMPYLRTKQAEELSHKLLRLITRYHPMIPADLRKPVKVFAGFDKTYRPPPDFLAQFEEHKTLFEQLTPDAEARYRQAVALLNAKPAGHA